MSLLKVLAALTVAAAASSALAQAPASPPAEPTVVGIVADPCVGRTALSDWPNLCRYRDENAALPPPQAARPRVVFMGDSITEGWRRSRPEFFEANGYVGRGISAQTTQHMVVRFQPDVIALRPRAVHIMAGVNDIAGNSGPTTMKAIQDNIIAMTTLARANGAAVVLASVLPAADFPWRPGMNPAPRIAELNAWLRAYAAREGFVYADYHSAMADERGGMRAGLARDGVHPGAEGYGLMEALTRKAIAEALARRRPR